MLGVGLPSDSPSRGGFELLTLILSAYDKKRQFEAGWLVVWNIYLT